MEEGEAPPRAKRRKGSQALESLGRREVLTSTELKGSFEGPRFPLCKVRVEYKETTEEGDPVANYQTIAASRLRSGRALHVSQCRGDIVLRVPTSSSSVPMVETVVRGRKWRLSFTDVEEAQAAFAERDATYDEIECEICGLRLGCARHKESHLAVSHSEGKVCKPVPAAADEEELRIRFVLKKEARWLKEVAGEPGKSILEETTDQDPLFGEAERTKVVTVRLRRDPTRNDARLAQAIANLNPKTTE